MLKKKIRLTTNHLIIFLLSIYIICVIPTVYVYLSHGHEELETSKNTTGHKHIKTLGEGLFFVLIGGGYILGSWCMFGFPNSKIPYLFLIVGTIAVVTLYFFRIFGIPIPFTDVVIRDLSTDWRDVATKIPQMIMLVPLSILLIIRAAKIKSLNRE